MEQVVTPPINYSMLCPGVHRSGYPTKRNFTFLQTLRLRSIMFLCPEAYADANKRFCEEQNIQFLAVPMEGNKEPFLDIPPEAMHRAVSLLCDARNHPILIHCNKGKHRTGTVCGCLRQLQGWSLTSTFDEYIRFAGDKARFVDQQYIELYRPKVYHTGPSNLSCIGKWVMRRDWVILIDNKHPHAAIISLDPPPAIVAPQPEKEKKDKKDKKDKKEKSEEAEGALISGESKPGALDTQGNTSPTDAKPV
jgi:tyrosine-protein phosphatase SIW14